MIGRDSLTSQLLGHKRANEHDAILSIAVMEESLSTVSGYSILRFSLFHDLEKIGQRDEDVELKGQRVMKEATMGTISGRIRVHGPHPTSQQQMFRVLETFFRYVVRFCSEN
jgi:hypothetical protein